MVLDCIQGYIGEYEQLPPMYSALKVNGKKLYELAREGIEIERKPRKVTIYDIHVDEIHLPRVRMTISCSKGTYIRALARDLGEALGSGAFLSSLRRTANGGFTIEDALTLDEAMALFTTNRKDTE